MNVLSKLQVNAQFLAASLQNIEQTFTGDAGDDMAATAYSGIPIENIDGIPDHEVVGDLLVGLIVGPLKRGECAIREDHAPTIGDIGGIALNDGDAISGIGFFDEQGFFFNDTATTE